MMYQLELFLTEQIQERISIIFPNETIMLENDDNDTNFLLNETKV
jgi:hypothetical protein